jgi:hypothetical protein
MISYKIVLVFICVFIYTGTSVCDGDIIIPPLVKSLEPGTKSPPAKIQEVSWIAGHWEGEALSRSTEEIWSSPRENSMMGMFRLYKGGAVVFYEFLTITEENGSLILRLKHFHPDLKGWEDKDETVSFPLVELNPNNVFFDGLSFRKITENKMTVFVRQRAKDGSLNVLKFQYKRAGSK